MSTATRPPFCVVQRKREPPSQLGAFYAASPAHSPRATSPRVAPRPPPNRAAAARPLRPSEALRVQSAIEARIARATRTTSLGAGSPPRLDASDATEADIAFRLLTPQLQPPGGGAPSAAVVDLCLGELERLLAGPFGASLGTAPAKLTAAIRAAVRAGRRDAQDVAELPQSHDNREPDWRLTDAVGAAAAPPPPPPPPPPQSPQRLSSPRGRIPPSSRGRTPPSPRSRTPLSPRGRTPPSPRRKGPDMAAEPTSLLRTSSMMETLVSLENEPDKQEVAAAAFIQRLYRGHVSRTLLPAVAKFARRHKLERRAAAIISDCARRVIVRRGVRRQLRIAAAARAIQRAFRFHSTGRWLKSLRAEGGRLSTSSYATVTDLRRRFFRLTSAERDAIVPALLALTGGRIEALVQARELWHTFSAGQRARSIADYLLHVPRAERCQVLKIGLQVADADELLELIRFVRAQSKRWGLSEGTLMQSFLEGQPARLASMSETKIIDALVELLPASTAARAMERLVVYSHLPPIRRHLKRPAHAYTRAALASDGGLFQPPGAEVPVEPAPRANPPHGMRCRPQSPPEPSGTGTRELGASPRRKRVSGEPAPGSYQHKLKATSRTQPRGQM